MVSPWARHKDFSPTSMDRACVRVRIEKPASKFADKLSTTKHQRSRVKSARPKEAKNFCQRRSGQDVRTVAVVPEKKGHRTKKGEK